MPAVGEDGEALEITPEDPTSALIFKTVSDPFSGKITILRVASGTLKSDTAYWNHNEGESERLGHLMAMQGKHGEAVPQLIAGDIGGIAKLKVSHSGQTIGEKSANTRLKWMRLRESAISFAIEPKAKGDEEKIGEALSRLMEEDPTLKARRDAQTGEFLISGSDQLHVEIAMAKLKDRYKVEVILHPPKVPYRETIKRPADGHGRHKKQSGGRGQFADCQIKMEPVADGQPVRVHR